MSQIGPATLAALGNFPALLEAAYAAVPDDRKHWRPASWHGIPSERLTAIEQVCHVHAIEVDGYRDRFHRTLTEERPELPDLDGELLAVAHRYAEADADDVLARFSAARAQTVRSLRALTAVQRDRVAIFEGRPTTLRGLVHFLCSHDFQHLAGMQWLLAMMGQGDRATP